MAINFEKAYEQHKLEKYGQYNLKMYDPKHEKIKKKAIPIWVHILIIMFVGAATKLLAREYGIFSGMIIVFSVIIGIASIAYFYSYAKKNHLASKIKNYTKSPSPDELLKWHDLKEKGVITEDEFEVHKKRILE